MRFLKTYMLNPLDCISSSISLLANRFDILKKATPDEDPVVGARVSVSAISGPRDGVSMISSRLYWLTVNSRFKSNVLVHGIADGTTRTEGVVRGKRHRPRESSLGTAIVNCVPAECDNICLRNR
jgi:hypothetical protein